MDNDQSLNNQIVEESKRGSFVDILYVLRSHLILIIIVTILFSIGGYIYGRFRQPVYTASVPVQFDVEIKDEKGEGIDQVSSTNYLFAYLDTAVGVCSGGEVIDRANVYYYFYLNSGMSIDKFIDHVYESYTEEVKKARTEVPGFEVTTERMNEHRNKWFRSGEMGTIYVEDKENTVINFRLWVKNLNAQYAREMVRIYVLAADVALNLKIDFGTATVGIIELNKFASGVSVGSDISMNRVIIVATALGALVALVIIYVMYLLDNTLKSKEMLEEMTGSSVIAYIDDVSEAKNG